MIEGFLNLPWFLWAGIALLIAVIYTFVWPHKTAIDSAGFSFFILRWGHGLTWILLTISFFLRGIDPSFNGAANLIALAAGLVYLLFIVITFRVK
jgi:hypothetical protein